MKHLGGQAIIDGVLIRNKNKIGIATVKKGKIKTVLWKLKEKPKFLKLIFIRGIYNLIETLVIGIKALNYSADEQLDKEEKISLWQLVLTLVISLSIGILIFKFFPLFVTEILNNSIGFLKNSVLFSLIEGILKLVIFILYVLLISRMKDVKRIFEFHGAEHKIVNAYENNDDNVNKYSIIHERCGSAFVFLVLFLTVVVYSFVSVELSLFLKLGYRLLLLIPIISLSYEILKFNSKYPNVVSKVLVYPGLLLQKLTVKKPSEEQIEVAKRALEMVV